MPARKQRSVPLSSRRRDRAARHLALPLTLLLFAFSGGTVGYMLIEGWPLGDALYMTVISLTTTGFQEVNELSPAGRVLTAAVILSGIASLAYVGGRAIQVVIERYLLRRGRMNKKIHRLRNHVILCGYGRMGRHIAADLAEAGIPFVVIETNEELSHSLEEHGHLYIVGDASADDLLRDAGVEHARGLIAVVSSDAENVYTTLTARSMNPDITIVARALTDESEPKLRKAGADRVIKPYEMVGRRIAQLVIRPAMVEFVETIARSKSDEITMEEITVTSESTLLGVALRDTSIRSKLNVIIVAIRREDEDLLYNPGPDAQFQSGDRLLAIGRSDELAELSVICGVTAR